MSVFYFYGCLAAVEYKTSSGLQALYQELLTHDLCKLLVGQCQCEHSSNASHLCIWVNIEPNTIYNLDCLVGMKYIADASIDLILCDLPYGTTQNKWDSVIPLADLWSHYKRIIKPGGVVVLTCQQPFTTVLGASNLAWLKHEWIWEKPSGTGFLNANRAPMKSHENILVFAPGSVPYNPQMEAGKPYVVKRGRRSSNYGNDRVGDAGGIEIITTNTGTRYPKTVLRFNRDQGLIHPTQKPVALFEYLIRTYTDPNGLVLDNAIGSGTTAVAALATLRRYIGFELDTEMYGKAVTRIEGCKQHHETTEYRAFNALFD